jgi:hypothetical protein
MAAVRSAGLHARFPSVWLFPDPDRGRSTAEIVDRVVARLPQVSDTSRLEAEFRLGVKRALRSCGSSPDREAEIVDRVVRVWRSARIAPPAPWEG